LGQDRGDRRLNRRERDVQPLLLVGPAGLGEELLERLPRLRELLRLLLGRRGARRPVDALARLREELLEAPSWAEGVSEGPPAAGKAGGFEPGSPIEEQGEVAQALLHRPGLGRRRQAPW